MRGLLWSAITIFSARYDTHWSVFLPLKVRLSSIFNQDRHFLFSPASTRGPLVEAPTTSNLFHTTFLHAMLTFTVGTEGQ